MQNKYKILMFGNLDGLSYGQIRDEVFIGEALEKLGHTIYKNDESKLSEADLVLAFKSNSFGAQHVRDWKSKTQAPIFIQTFDNMDRFTWFYEIAKECNLWLGEEIGRADRFKQEGIPFYRFPNHAVNSEIFRPMGLPKIYDVSFTGTAYFPERTEMLRAIEDYGFNLHIFGNSKSSWEQAGFKNVYGPVFDGEFAKVVSQSKIMIGISNTFLAGYWSIRPAQVMLCKGMMIDRYNPLMEQELKDGIEYWSTHEELLEKIRYYLDNDIARLNIAQRGYEIATQNFTNLQRCKELIILFERYKQIGDKILDRSI